MQQNEPQLKKGQVWRDVNGVGHLIIGRSKSKGFVSWSYAVHKAGIVDPATLTTLLQDVCPPRDEDERPRIPSAGAFTWSPEDGFQQSRGASAGAMGVTELARMEDAQAAVSDALAQRDAAISSVGVLREAVTTFSAALDAGFASATAAAGMNDQRQG